MKKLLCILIVSCAIDGCNNPVDINKNESIKEAQIKYNKQKEDFISKFKLDSIEKKNNTLYPISGKIKYKKMWCGGVQIRAFDHTYDTKPYANKTLLIINGIVNSDTCIRVKELKTNAKGEFDFEIKSGIYGLIVEEWKQGKFKKPAGEYEDINCLRKEYKKPDLIIRVKNEPINNLSYTVIGYCNGGNPCNPMAGTGLP